MSPEQARGKPVDKRSDIWAFGVVLLEMFTGKAVFAGETVTDVLAAVVTRARPRRAACRDAAARSRIAATLPAEGFEAAPSRRWRCPHRPSGSTGRTRGAAAAT